MEVWQSGYDSESRGLVQKCDDGAAQGEVGGHMTQTPQNNT
jgi:hypothetical protein